MRGARGACLVPPSWRAGAAVASAAIHSTPMCLCVMRTRLVLLVGHLLLNLLLLLPLLLLLLLLILLLVLLIHMLLLSR